MTKEQAIKAAQQIKERFLLQVHPVRTIDGTGPEHLVWMIEQLPTLSENKTMHWLGYIQGVLVAQEYASLEDMKELSRKAVS